MTAIKMEVEGLGEMIRALGGTSKKLDAELRKAVVATGLELRTDIIRRYNDPPKTGRIYRKYKPSRTHRASAPGQSPATDTGRLAGGTVFRETAGGTEIGVEVTNQIKYARALEFGTARVAMRPAWRPAVAALEAKFLRRILDALLRGTE
jgi:hypothetical protein